MAQLLWEVWQFLSKLKMGLLHDTAIVRLVIYPRKINIFTEELRHIHSRFMHMSPNCKLRRYLSTYWYIHIIAYYSARKKQWMTMCNNLNELKKNNAEWRKSIPKVFILQDSICVTIMKLHNYGNRDRTSGF